MGSDYPFNAELLDLHLGRLDPAQAADLTARLLTDPELARQNDALAGVFRALDSQRHVKAPADLAVRIKARATAGRAPCLFRARDQVTEALEHHPTFSLRLGNLRDILAAAAAIILAVGVGVPGLLHMRERSQRMVCTSNLAALGQGLQQYAQTYAASLPFAGIHGRSSWRPTPEPGVVTMPNRRHVYPLLRYAFVREPRLFVCPAHGGVPMPTDEVRTREDFIESSNLTYSYYNMAGAKPTLDGRADLARLPILADQNPLFEDGVPLFSRIRLIGADELNSPNHRGAGQNLLLFDGHVEWTRSPLAGIDGDNIWTLNGVEEYTGREGPESPTDAHLIK